VAVDESLCGWFFGLCVFQLCYLEGVLSFTRFMEIESADDALERLKASLDKTEVLDGYVDCFCRGVFACKLEGTLVRR
jgi:hypothetical protein